MRTSNRRVVGVALAALVAGTGACASGAPSPSAPTSTVTEQAPPSVSAPSPATSSASAPATTAEPDIPAAARPATKDGAQQFVAFWVAQFNAGMKHADPTLISALSNTTCPGCQQLITQTREIQQSGMYVDGDLWSLRGTYVTEFKDGAGAVVLGSVRQNPVALMERSELVVKKYSDETSDLAFSLSRRVSHWQVDRLQLSK